MSSPTVLSPEFLYEHARRWAESFHGRYRDLAQRLRLNEDDFVSAVGLALTSFRPSPGCTSTRHMLNELHNVVTWRCIDTLRHARTFGEEIEGNRRVFTLDGVDVPDECEGATQVDESDAFEHLLEPLPARWREVVAAYYRDGATLDEAGAVIGVRKVRAHNIIKESLGLIRNHLARVG